MVMPITPKPIKRTPTSIDGPVPAGGPGKLPSNIPIGGIYPTPPPSVGGPGDPRGRRKLPRPRPEPGPMPPTPVPWPIPNPKPVPTPGSVPGGSPADSTAVGQGGLTAFGEQGSQLFQGVSAGLGGGFYKGMKGQQIWADLLKRGFVTGKYPGAGSGISDDEAIKHFGQDARILPGEGKVAQRGFLEMLLSGKFKHMLGKEGREFLLQASRGEHGKRPWSVMPGPRPYPRPGPRRRPGPMPRKSPGPFPRPRPGIPYY